MRAVTDDDVRIKVLDEPFHDAQNAGLAPPVEHDSRVFLTKPGLAA